MPSSSSARSTSSTAPLSPSELAALMLDPTMENSINRTFAAVPSLNASLRHFHYVCENIERIEKALARHYDERDELFDHMLESQPFQDSVQPLVHDYRHRSRNVRFNQGRQPTVKKPRFRSQPYRKPTPFPSTTSSSSGSSSILSYETAGSSTNPINVDAIDEETLIIIRPRDESLRPQFHPQCERCGRYGHEKPDCDTKMRSFNFCDICEWLGRRQRLCDHYDVTPMDIRRLRGDKIPYDHDE